MLRSVPFAWCELLLLKLVSTFCALSAFDAIHAHASPCAVVRELSRPKTIGAHPPLTLDAFPRGALRFLQLDTLFATFAPNRCLAVCSIGAEESAP